MNKMYCIFIGWEPRCLESFKLSLKDGFDSCIAFYSNEYEPWTAETRLKIENLCTKHDIPCDIQCIDVFNPASCWKQLYASLKEITEQNILLDFTTMPRSVLWSALGIFEHNKCNIDYVYAKPKGYGKDLTANPDTPWVQPKQSGIPDLDKPSALVLTVGFDTDRTEQLIKYFSPNLVLLFGQHGQDYKSYDRCINSHISEIINRPQDCYTESECGKHTSCVNFYEIDAYSFDHGFSVIDKHVSAISEKFNILLSSLGPKPTAIAIYKIFKKHSDSALVYVPYKDISLDYSYGYKSRVNGSI